jgi:hypothetical protein
MKWGSEFTSRHVNALYAGVLRNMEEVFDFVCLTDDGQDLVPGIRVHPIPDIGLPQSEWRRGCWPKLGVFAPHLFPSEDVVLFLDLDVMVQRSLALFINIVRKRRQLVIQREWNPDLWSLLPYRLRPDRGAQSSVFGFCPTTIGNIYGNFTSDVQRIVQTTKNDQIYLTRKVKRRTYWPDGFCVSFKRSCTKYVPFNILFPTIRQPSKARIVVFHGKPRPRDTLVEDGQRWGSKRRFGVGPVPWIQRYFAQSEAIVGVMQKYHGANSPLATAVVQLRKTPDQLGVRQRFADQSLSAAGSPNDSGS